MTAVMNAPSMTKLEQMIVDAHHRGRVKTVWKDRPTAFALELTRSAVDVIAAMREFGWTVKVASVLDRTTLLHELDAERKEGRFVLRVWASKTGGEKPWSVHATREDQSSRNCVGLYSEQASMIDVRDALLMAVAAAMDPRSIDEAVGGGVDTQA